MDASCFQHSRPASSRRKDAEHCQRWHLASVQCARTSSPDAQDRGHGTSDYGWRHRGRPSEPRYGRAVGSEEEVDCALRYSRACGRGPAMLPRCTRRGRLRVKASVGVFALLLGATLPCAASEDHGGHARGLAESPGHHRVPSPSAHQHHDPAQDSEGGRGHSSRQPCCHDNLLGVAPAITASSSWISLAAATTPALSALPVSQAAPAGAGRRFLFRVHPPAPPQVPIFLTTSSLLI